MYVLKMYIKLNLFILNWMKRRRGLNVFGSPDNTRKRCIPQLINLGKVFHTIINSNADQVFLFFKAYSKGK